MKRSEAIDILADYLIIIHPFGEIDLQKLKKDTENLLSLIEEDLGMLPPGKTYAVHGVVTHLNNEWDKEDE